jgi:Family of unknown function (DUF6221)
VTDLVAFLSARLDEDEGKARLAAREGGTWKQEDPERWPGRIVSLGGVVVYDELAPDDYQAEHIARHDPARVLREVEAKRAILELYEAAVEHDDTSLGVATLRTVVKTLAKVWREHPDYDPAWVMPASG